MEDKNYIIRTMKPEEVSIAVEWAAKEGWNPGLHDAECYSLADSNGFFVGLLDGEPIATISAVKYDESFGFVGFYIVKPEYRGKGYGIQIWNAALKYLEEANAALDGVVEQQENYKKSGFKLAYRNIRYEGVSGGEVSENPDIVELSTLPFESVDSYDRQFFPANRSNFVKAWINQPDSHALGILKDDKLVGYGVIRQCRVGYKVGPLYADSPELAESLFATMKSRVKSNEPIFLDTAEVNQDAVALAERHNMNVSFETARMYTKETPKLPIDRTFGITSFEIG